MDSKAHLLISLVDKNLLDTNVWRSKKLLFLHFLTFSLALKSRPCIRFSPTRLLDNKCVSTLQTARTHQKWGISRDFKKGFVNITRKCQLSLTLLDPKERKIRLLISSRQKYQVLIKDTIQHCLVA